MTYPGDRHVVYINLQETYGEDPFLSGVYATNYVQGLQGNDSRYIRASAGCKHFNAHGGPESIPVSRMSFNAVVRVLAFKQCLICSKKLIFSMYRCGKACFIYFLKIVEKNKKREG